MRSSSQETAAEAPEPAFPLEANLSSGKRGKDADQDSETDIMAWHVQGLACLIEETITLSRREV